MGSLLWGIYSGQFMGSSPLSRYTQFWLFSGFLFCRAADHSFYSTVEECESSSGA